MTPLLRRTRLPVGSNILVIFGDDIGQTNISTYSMGVMGYAFKVHIDGHNQLPYLTGLANKSPRRGFFYFDDDGDQ